jgi:hypothetical protein
MDIFWGILLHCDTSKPAVPSLSIYLLEACMNHQK